MLLSDFKQCLLVGFLWSCLSHVQCTKLQYPKLCLAYQDLWAFVLLVLIFSCKSKQRKTVLCLFICLIDKSSLSSLFFYNINIDIVTFHMSNF